MKVLRLKRILKREDASKDLKKGEFCPKALIYLKFSICTLKTDSECDNPVAYWIKDVERANSRSSLSGTKSLLLKNHSLFG
ncbi:hypothetical protein L596_016564 [Steinernema carpocapsae]|uniref:Uncharacterized protein n=1 Tax=Steinernema carpocapsae TaxID=34508 RepID=A0A4U5NJD8_STECR|nr:hypothetical protein L596_016564 [Steinernema carpocapsae]